jgi:ATP-binding cassette subfamily B protein
LQRAHQIAPAIVFQKGAETPRFFVVCGGSRRKLRVLGPDGRSHRVDVSTAAGTIWASVEAAMMQDLEPLLAGAIASATRRARIHDLWLNERTQQGLACEAWLLRPSPHAGLKALVARDRIGQRALSVIALYLAQYAAGLAALGLVGAAVFRGSIDQSTLLAIALSLATALVCAWCQSGVAAELSVRVGAALKMHTLAVALRAEPDNVRRHGTGQLLGRVLDNEALETLAIHGGLSGALSAVELMVALVTISLSSGLWLSIVLIAWAAIWSSASLRYLSLARAFSKTRIALTDTLTESMVGHRTRIVQETAEHWHAGEDEALERYLEAGRRAEAQLSLITGLASRGWIAVSILVLGGQWFHAQTLAPAVLAAKLVGVWIAARAWSRFGQSLAALCDARLAYERMAVASTEQPRPAFAIPPAFDHHLPAEPGELLLRADDLSYFAPRGTHTILRACRLQLHQGERLLLRGRSGSGKTTLVSLLAGLREPEGGTLLLRGFDRHTLGSDNWRRAIAMAPQFHENHLWSGTLAFNLLLGRSWPPSSDDLAEAEALCLELGLEGLLKHMPSRLQQQVGDAGWQLSHGERSRVFLARALLQRAQLVVLDETFAALDPETAVLSLRCAVRHAKTLIVVAHP